MQIGVRIASLVSQQVVTAVSCANTISLKLQLTEADKRCSMLTYIKPNTTIYFQLPLESRSTSIHESSTPLGGVVGYRVRL